MKIRILKDDLLENLQIVQNIVNPKNTLPILSNILLDAQNNNLKMNTTDLDIGILVNVPAEVFEAGSITIPARKMFEIIRDLPSGAIDLTVRKNNMVIIESHKCQFKIMGLPKDEFPKIPSFEDKKAVKIEQKIFKEMLNLTYFAVSRDETRYILNGVLIEIKQNKLKLITTDGRRLAVVEKELSSHVNQEIKIIIPTKTIQELIRNLKDEDVVSIILGLNQVMFDLSGGAQGNQRVLIISRLIEGEFPNYQQVIPQPVDNKITINREEFLSALKRANLLSTTDYQAVKLEVFKNKMVVSKSTPDIGESKEEVGIGYAGKEMVVGFNPVYLIDVLKNIKNDDIILELADSEKPGVLRQDGYVYVVLPMRLS
ncbi:MAG: DNA polymerase III subunit beta [Candidatus Omnitrophica bacterium CG11_big_fil_rev_8_21_14_0_20_42_13]|uniref:Beta sliding clamp n=1 Tax=Candidatus Ghiorseimicrobium undicola TaxID=1974746 RepID=A0A2H0LXU6_9BACT|nr:MAG: DNA polymerase III subunit beta [Candidatus Omnitrophica bacterium CG11_big_fil_rev_8_21_14_0_20_42_13]